jgi:hypothetical protein
MPGRGTCIPSRGTYPHDPRRRPPRDVRLQATVKAAVRWRQNPVCKCWGGNSRELECRCDLQGGDSRRSVCGFRVRGGEGDDVVGRCRDAGGRFDDAGGKLRETVGGLRALDGGRDRPGGGWRGCGRSLPNRGRCSRESRRAVFSAWRLSRRTSEQRRVDHEPCRQPRRARVEPREMPCRGRRDRVLDPDATRADRMSVA